MMDSSFSEVVKKIVERVKSTRGGVKKLTEATGKNAALISHWKTGRYVPSVTDQVDFIESSNTLIKQLDADKAKQEKKLKKLTSLLTA